jgi:hypothetical protein
MLVVKGTACISNSKTNYHTITTASFLDLFGLVYGDLTPLSTIFQLYPGGQLYCSGVKHHKHPTKYVVMYMCVKGINFSGIFILSTYMYQ